MRHPLRVRHRFAAAAAALLASAPAATAAVRRPGTAVTAVVAAVVAVALLALPTVAAAHDDNPFSDVADSGTHSADIHTLDHQGVFEGTLCGDDLFCPWDPLTRAEMAVWLVRVLDGADPAAVTATRFSDVDGDHPHGAFIERFAELGVTYGCDTDPLRYCPDDNVTRAQMASFLVRAFDLTGGEPAGFVDVTAGGVHSADIDTLAATGITYGCDTDPLRYCPSDDVSRAQMASFLVRADEYVPSAPDDAAESTTPEGVTPTAMRVAPAMTRCASDTGWYGAGRASVYAGTTSGGFYEPVVTGGADSCERIKTWWYHITAAEALRIAEGRYPCEHTVAYEYRRNLHVNGPALLAGCWPRLLVGVAADPQHRLDDPAEEASRLRNLEGSWINPPNFPELVIALYDCYRDALEGPPLGWEPPSGGEWPTVVFCHAGLNNFGNPVRYMGVTPACAAAQYSGQVQERKLRGWVGGAQYEGDFSWVNCETHVSRLLTDELEDAPLRVRCEAVIDAAVRPAETAAAAEGYGLSTDTYLAEIKDMYCQGSRAGLNNYPQFHGDWVASWLPPDGSICWEAALLDAARTAAYGKWTQVKFC